MRTEIWVIYIYSYGIRRYINAANIRILYSVLDSLNDFNSHRPVISIAADLFCMIQSLYFWTTDLYGKNKMHLNKRDENEHFLLPGLNLIFNSNQLNITINEVLINYWELQVLVTFILHLLKFPLLTTERQCKHCTHDIKATLEQRKIFYWIQNAYTAVWLYIAQPCSPIVLIRPKLILFHIQIGSYKLFIQSWFQSPMSKMNYL